MAALFTFPNYQHDFSRTRIPVGEFPLPPLTKPPPPVLDQPVRHLSQSHINTPKDLPQTNADWRSTLAEVKRHYQHGRYRPCATLCHEILDNVRHLTILEATYLIYLHFYAASCLEMLVRNLHLSSPHRIKLLKSARGHYRRAIKLIKIEDDSLSQCAHDLTSPSLSSLHSPTSSLSTISSCPSSRMSSPCPSSASLRSDIKIRRKKRVTFSDSIVSFEPFIRPDSPTLGSDDWFDRNVPDPPVLDLHGERPKLSLDLSYSSIAPESNRGFIDPFARARAVHRYGSILTQLQRQAVAHLTSVDIEITTMNCCQPSLPTHDDLNSLELHGRIERLRATGWQRPRFDPSRYEALRENAMADLTQ